MYSFLYNQFSISDLSVGSQKWQIHETPLIKVQQPLSSPKLTWHGRWLIKNRDKKEEIQLNYAGEEVSGHLTNQSRMITINGSIHRPQIDGQTFKLIEPSYFVQK